MYQNVYEAYFIQHLHVQKTSNTYYNELKKTFAFNFLEPFTKGTTKDEDLKPMHFLKA